MKYAEAQLNINWKIIFWKKKDFSQFIP